MADRDEFNQFMETAMEKYMTQYASFLEEVMVFIDSGYLQYCLKEQFGRTDIDLTKFALKLAHGRRLKRTYYYTAKIERPPNQYWQKLESEQRRFFMSLAKKSFIETRLGRLKYTGDGVAQQKGVDVLLALDMLRFALKCNYTVAILVSGDGDFADIVRMVKDEGRKVEIAIFSVSLSLQLLEACDECIEITTEFLEDCWEKDS